MTDSEKKLIVEAAAEDLLVEIEGIASFYGLTMTEKSGIIKLSLDEDHFLDFTTPLVNHEQSN